MRPAELAFGRQPTLGGLPPGPVGGDRPLAAVANGVAACQLGYLLPDGLRVLGAEIGATRIEPLVVVELIRVVAGERLEEVLARPGSQEEQVRPHSAGARLTGRTPSSKTQGTGNPRRRFEERTADELRNLASQRHVAGASSMSKPQLIEALRGKRGR